MNTEDPSGEVRLNDRLGALLPDDFSESKDWKAGNIYERIEWLKNFNNIHRKEIERIETQLIEILEQLGQSQDRSEKYREALVKIAETRKPSFWDSVEIARAALSA